MAAQKMDDILESLGLGFAKANFETEKIVPSIIESMTDEHLIRLGIQTIGDRIRLREACKRSQTQQPETFSESQVSTAVANNSNNSHTGLRQLSSIPARERIIQGRNNLFGQRQQTNPSRSGFSARRSTSTSKRSCSRGRSWTANFFCLADKFAMTVPDSLLRIRLQKAGLGLKKIKLFLGDDEETVFAKIKDSFPQVATCGGIELLLCPSQSKELLTINCSLSAQAIKEAIGGGQGRIYIRPIQENLSTKSTISETESKLKEVCFTCKKEFLLSNLRSHMRRCKNNLSSASSTDCSDFEDEKVNVNDGDSSNQEQLMVREQVIDLTRTTHSQVQETVTDEETATTNLAFNITVENPSIRKAPDPVKYDIDLKIAEIINVCKEKKIKNNPVEILRLLQKELVQGRELEIRDTAVVITGATNDIMVDRDNVLETGLNEIKTLEDKSLCLVVQFYDEVAEDFGGPRREFFRLILKEIKEKIFDYIEEDGSLPESPDYYQIGVIFALSILQNGNQPKFIGENGIEEIFHAEHPKPGYADIRKAFKEFGLYQIGTSFPIFLHILRENEHERLTHRRLIQLLKPEFGENGSNERKFQNSIYSLLIKYMREAGSGRRGNVTLQHVLKFVTGSEHEPLLGFSYHPSIKFVVTDSSKFLPTSNTCINQLNLPRATTLYPLPSEDVLFNIYDFAFSSEYFGQV